MRKQSPETQLRHAKIKIRSLKFYADGIKQELAQRKQVGQIMSNLCFNLAQNDSYDPAARQMMRDCREMWDKIRNVSI